MADMASGSGSLSVAKAKSASSSWSLCFFFILRIELTTDEAADSGKGALGRAGSASRAAAAAARVWGGGGGGGGAGLSTLEGAEAGAETRRLLEREGRRLGMRLAMVMVAFVGVVGTGVAFGLRSASGARPAATTRESGRFRAALAELIRVERETVEVDRGLLVLLPSLLGPSVCVSGGERRGILDVDEGKETAVYRIRKVRRVSRGYAGVS